MLQSRTQLRNPAGACSSVWSGRNECQRPASASTSAYCSPVSLPGRVSGSDAAPRGGVCGASRRANRVTGRRGRLQKVAAYQPYPFWEEDYHKASVSLVIAGGEHLEGGAAQGTVLLSKAAREGEQPGARPRALVLFVAGDTLLALSQLLQGVASIRPMALDLLWQILERGQQISESMGSRSKWRLVRMAIVEMRNQVYHGRLYFGDAASGEVVWDTDARPSDGLWLAIKSACPIYIKRSVWDECSTEVEAEGGGTLDDALKNFRAIGIGSSGTLRASPEDDLSGTALLTTVRQSDPEPIKRLKREMQVAISEEDFKTAARLRDHPWMQLHRRSQEARSSDDMQEARRLEAELSQKIEEHERPPDKDAQAESGGN